MSNAETVKRPRRRFWIPPTLLVLAALAVLALPWALSSRTGRVWLLEKANRALKPGTFDLSTLKFSWFGPTRMTGFVIRNARGEPVVEAPSATWDRNLAQVLFERPELGTLRLDHAAVEVERAPDGSIDLYETLRPVIGLDPKTGARIEVRDGRLRVRGRGLVEPVAAEHTEIRVEITPRPGPITWKVNLVNGDPASSRNSLAVDGRLDPKAAAGDLEIRVTGKDWPWTFGRERGVVSGRLDGGLSAHRREGRWTLSGDAALAGLNAAGPETQGRSLGVDRLRGVWNLSQTAEGWEVGRFELTTSRATFKAAGVVGGGGAVRLDGEAGVGEGTDAFRGRWSATATVGTDNGGLQVDGGLDLVRLGADSGDGERVRLRVKASAPAGGDRLDLAAMQVDTRFGSADASGRVDDLRGERVVDLSGKVSPHWDLINTWLAENVEPGATLEGTDRPFRVRAAIGGRFRKSLDGEVGVALKGLDVYGMKLGPTALVLRAAGGKLSIDPIDTTVNEGRLHVEPEIREGDDSGPPALVLGPGTTLTDAAVNDEVSRRVLSFVAPVLDNATRVRGRVSAAIHSAVFPVGGTEPGKGPTVEGAVTFQNVEFVPGPLLDGLFALAGREDRPALKLDEPVALTIADRRVYQKGLTVPIGKLSKIEIEGSVGFDRTLDLTASVPVLPTMLADRPILNAVAGEARVRVPIRGTLKQPEVDREAFKLGMRDMGKSLLERGALQGAAGLFERLTRPRDPDAPPPPTAEERQLRRQEKKAERQLRRGRRP